VRAFLYSPPEDTRGCPVWISSLPTENEQGKVQCAECSWNYKVQLALVTGCSSFSCQRHAPFDFKQENRNTNNKVIDLVYDLLIWFDRVFVGDINCGPPQWWTSETFPPPPRRSCDVGQSARDYQTTKAHQRTRHALLFLKLNRCRWKCWRLQLFWRLLRSSLARPKQVGKQ